MTVQNQNVKNVYRGNGSTTVFPFTFAINESHPEYIHVYITNDGGKAAETTDFTCDMETRTITYPKVSSSAPKLSATQRLTIYRLLPYEQNLNLVNQGPFFSEDVETQLDDLEMQIQQLNEEKGRSLRIGLEVTDFETEIPLVPGKTFRVKDDGTGFEITDDPNTAREAAEAAQEAAERAQGIAEEARDDAEAAATLTELQAVWFDDGTELRTTDIPVGMTAGTKGYFAANDGGNAVYIIRAKTQEDVDDGGSIIFLENGNVAELITDGTVNAKQFGAKGDGVTDDTAAFRAAINNGYNVYVPNGHYILTEEIENTTGLTMYGDGDETILDWGDSLPSGTGLTISGSLTALPSIANASKGDLTVTFASTHGLSVGDIFCIYNPTDYSWSGWRPYYRAGEWCKVVDINGLTVTLLNPLYDSYTGASVDVYKLTSVPVNLHDFAINGTSSRMLLKVSFCSNVVMSNIKSNLEKYACVWVDKCYDVLLNNLFLYNKGTTQNDYGLIIGNSQRVAVQGGYYYGRRHGITTGGDSEVCCVSCRQINIFKAVLDNNPLANQPSNGFHGNIEDALVSDCVLFGEVNSAGRNIVIQNCKVIDNGKTSSIMLSLSEINGGTHIFQNTTIVAGSVDNIYAYGYSYMFISNAVKDTKVNVIFKNNSIEVTRKRKINYR